MGNHRLEKILKICLLIFWIYSVPIFSDDIPVMENLDYENPKLIQLRNEVKKNLKASKSNLELELTPLRFVKYKVIHGDNFFKIMSRTGMDIDTISSVNSLSSPQDIRVGMVLYIPNMRGIYDRDEIPPTEEGRLKVSQKYNIRESLPIYDEHFAGEWFIPGKILGKTEKAFFYGLAFVPPLKEGFTSSGFGVRNDPFTKKKTFHGGIDIAAVKGTAVYASQEGLVIFAGKKGGYGKLVVIKHAIGYETRYGHLDEISVKVGDKIRKDEQLGTVGNTGRATGYHLHFEVRRFHKNQKPIFYKHM
jgi:murein DD-endopeptidase MepM/ murein hydrolase activator NlpD